MVVPGQQQIDAELVHHVQRLLLPADRATEDALVADRQREQRMVGDEHLQIVFRRFLEMLRIICPPSKR